MPADPRLVAIRRKAIEALYPPERWHALHLQMIYFGRAKCPARGHEPAECPICSWAMSAARARAERMQNTGKPTRQKARRA